MKKNLNEQISRIKQMMGRINESQFDDFDTQIQPEELPHNDDPSLTHDSHMEDKKKFSIVRNDRPYDFGPYTHHEAKEKVKEYVHEGGYNGDYYQIMHYNDALSLMPAYERQGMARLDKDDNLYFPDDTPFSQGDLADY